MLTGKEVLSRAIGGFSVGAGIAAVLLVSTGGNWNAHAAPTEKAKTRSIVLPEISNESECTFQLGALIAAMANLEEAEELLAEAQEAYDNCINDTPPPGPGRDVSIGTESILESKN